MSPYFHLLIIYFIWGSTFVAMRAAVVGNSGFGPFYVGSSRLAIASLALFAWARLRKMNLRLNHRDLFVCATSGILTWLGGNALVMWAEQWVDAGYATLGFSTMPIWTLFLGCFLDKKLPSFALMMGALFAFFGMFLLGGTHLLTNTHDVLIPTLVILLSAILWSISTHLQKRKPLSCRALVGSAYQQLFGGLGVFIMALVMKESWPHPTTQAWFAWWYLVIFGSMIAYSSYIIVVKHFPPSISMTFAYVCPVLTVILGHFILDEPLSFNKLSGMVMILSSVIWIFHQQRKGNLRTQKELVKTIVVQS